MKFSKHFFNIHKYMKHLSHPTDAQSGHSKLISVSFVFFFFFNLLGKPIFCLSTSV